jgi:hypothetical protein
MKKPCRYLSNPKQVVFLVLELRDIEVGAYLEASEVKSEGSVSYENGCFRRRVISSDHKAV